MEIKNLKKAGLRIKKAIKGNENIVLFSDSDLDGTTSLIIMEQAIKNLGGKVSIYFPDRDKEGYGLNIKALNKFSSGLLILLDCGITNFKEVKIAQEKGLEVIIIEHHEIIDKLPEAEIVVNPKQEGDNYAFKTLATCGLCFYLAKELDISDSLEKNLLELVALGTIADKMPQIEDNRILIDKGLEYIESSFRPGIKIFFKMFPHYSLKETIQRMVGILQITEVKKHLTESYLLLNAKDEKQAEKVLNRLIKKSLGKQELIKSLFEDICNRVSEDSLFVFEGDEKIPMFLSGALATRVCNKFKKPAFIFGIKKDRARGSIRCPQDINSIEALKKCSHLLDTFGGHAPASGFSLKKENLDKFKKCLEQYYGESDN